MFQPTKSLKKILLMWGIYPRDGTLDNLLPRTFKIGKISLQRQGPRMKKIILAKEICLFEPQPQNCQLSICCPITRNLHRVASASLGVFLRKECASANYCAEHEPEVEENATSSGDSSSSEGCKMLWFAGFHEENTCNEKGTGYKIMYSAALNSAILNAGESLQPVLMLGRLGLDDASNTTASSLYTRTCFSLTNCAGKGSIS